jgi:hypothetical protein
VEITKRGPLVRLKLQRRKEMNESNKVKTKYEVTIEAVLPVICHVTVEAHSEAEAASLALRIAQRQGDGVKSERFDIEPYPSEFLKIHGVFEVTPVDPDDAAAKRRTREQIETLLDQANH